MSPPLRHSTMDKETKDYFDEKFNAVSARFTKLEANIEGLAVATKESFDHVEKRFDRLYEFMRAGLDEVNDRVTRLYRAVDGVAKDLRERVEALEKHVGLKA